MKKYYRAIFLAILALNLLFGYFQYRQCKNMRGGDDNVIEQLGLLAKMLRIIRQEYVANDKLRSEELIARAMSGMASGLDEHSAFIKPRAAKAINAELSGKMGGIGITTSAIDNHLMVVFVGKDTPADKAGIQAWDEIISVDGESVQNKSYEDAVMSIRGEIGTPVTLEIQRGMDENATKLSFTITRGNISAPSVWNAQLIENTHCAYFTVQGFMENTPALLEEDINKMLKEHPDIDSMILDLRGNGGGLLDCAVRICSFFLPEGQLIVTSRMQNTAGFEDATLYEKSHYAGKGMKVKDNIKLAVLVDRNSASASEITAGCLQDLHRAIIVGEKTYGKGSVQTLFNIGGGNVLKLTVAHYHTPNKDRVIDKVGITPDVICEPPRRNRRAFHRRRLFGKMHPQYDPCVRAALEAMEKEKNNGQ